MPRPASPPSPSSPPSPKSSAFDWTDSAPPSHFKPHVFRPKLSFASSPDGRRPSVAFAAHNHDGHRAASPKPHPPPTQRRMSSPPPPSTYETRVSFDTFVNRDATDFSYTLIAKHKHYHYSARSRTFLCGTDQNDYSEFALEWLIDELVEDGDEIVCLRVVDKDSKINSDASLHEGRYKAEAQKLMEHIQSKNKDDEKIISLILEYSVGKVPDTIQRMINIHSPACLIVGTRGRSLGGIQGLLPGSVSKYCLQNSPVPVVVVRPSAKRDKKKRKRQADPSRRTYMNILQKSGVSGSQMWHKSERDKRVGQHGGEATETEAQAVAEAIGIPDRIGAFAGFRKDAVPDDDGGSLTQTTSMKSDYTSEPNTPSPDGGLSPDSPAPGERHSPTFDDLDSPALSDDEEDEEDEQEGEEGDEDEDNDDEEKGANPAHKGKNTAAVHAARKMEAGEGKYLKPEARLAEETMES